MFLMCSQYVLQVDQNMRRRNAPVQLIEQDFYGRVLLFLALPLPSTCPYRIGTLALETCLLALIEPISWEPESLSFPMRFYWGDGANATQIIDMLCIHSSVGHIKDWGRWALIEQGNTGHILATIDDDVR